MPGRQPLDHDSEARLLGHLDSLAPRDRLLLVMGLHTGLRIHELLSLQVRQVWNGRNRCVPAHLHFARRQLKGGRGERRRAVHSRTLPINQALRAEVERFIAAQPPESPDQPLFASRKFGAITPRHALRILTTAFEQAGLRGHGVWGTHTLRKTFCQRIYAASGNDLVVTRAAMGHAHLQTTERYLSAPDSTVQRLILQLGESRPAEEVCATPGSAMTAAVAAVSGGERAQASRGW